MANNETIAQLPKELDTQVGLKRFLAIIVEQIDIMLGYRGGDPYVKNSALTELNESIDKLSAEVEKQSTEQEPGYLDLENEYRDFNHVGYYSLNGKGEFVALGSQISNSPISLTGSTTYNVYVDSYVTLSGGVVQQFYLVHTGGLLRFDRAGPSSAELKTLVLS
jgi:hypothetical protein